MWLLLQGAGTEPALSSSVCRLGAIPADLLGYAPPGATLRIGPNTCTLAQTPNYYAVFTSMFLHGGWFHLIGNLWFLAVFGDNVEDVMTPARFVLFYVLCGLAAVAVHVAFNPTSALPMVGASGAIGGVMGAYAVLFPRVHVHMLLFFGFFFSRAVVPAYLMLGYWFLIQLLSGLPALSGVGAGVAFWAHVGGFVAGIALIPLFRMPERVEAQRRKLEALTRDAARKGD